MSQSLLDLRIFVSAIDFHPFTGATVPASNLLTPVTAAA